MQNAFYDELGLTEQELIERYPFARGRIYHGKLLDTSWYGLIPKGWRTSFGKELLTEMESEYNVFDKELQADWIVTDVKEKYGELRIDTGRITSKMDDIIEKYTDMSAHFCKNCGNLCEQRTVNDWVYILCDECYDLMRNIFGGEFYG